jgi:cell division protein FtsL
MGIARAREESRLEQRRAALVAERASLEGAIRDASSRSKLARVAEERLRMQIPNDSQVVFVSRPPALRPRK